MPQFYEAVNITINGSDGSLVNLEPASHIWKAQDACLDIARRYTPSLYRLTDGFSPGFDAPFCPMQRKS